MASPRWPAAGVGGDGGRRRSGGGRKGWPGSGASVEAWKGGGAAGLGNGMVGRRRHGELCSPMAMAGRGRDFVHEGGFCSFYRRARLRGVANDVWGRLIWPGKGGGRRRQAATPAVVLAHGRGAWRRAKWPVARGK